MTAINIQNTFLSLLCLALASGLFFSVSCNGTGPTNGDLFETADEYVRAGERMIAQGEFARAARMFHQALQKDEDHFRARLRIIDAYAHRVTQLLRDPNPTRHSERINNLVENIDSHFQYARNLRPEDPGPLLSTSRFVVDSVREDIYGPGLLNHENLLDKLIQRSDRVLSMVGEDELMTRLRARYYKGFGLLYRERIKPVEEWDFTAARKELERYLELWEMMGQPPEEVSNINQNVQDLLNWIEDYEADNNESGSNPIPRSD